MNTDPDLPDVSSLDSSCNKVSTIAPARAVRGYLEEEESNERTLSRGKEMDFRKRVLQAFERLSQREDMASFVFAAVIIEGEWMVDISDKTGERVGLVSARWLVDYAERDSQDSFLVNRQC